MALVSYSDSEASDSETGLSTPAAAPAPAAAPNPSSSSNPTTNFHSIVDRSNPRKIRVALPTLKPETPDESEDGPARKKPRIGGAGAGAFSGFNSFLPAPKRANAAPNTAGKKKAPARKIFSLKTGAGPGFDREADAEMRKEQAFAALSGGGGDDEFIPKAGSLREEEGDSFEKAAGTEEDGGSLPGLKKPEEVKLKGNPMMFKPLSVGRNQPKKRVVIGAKATSSTSTTAGTAPASSAGPKGGEASISGSTGQASQTPTPSAPPPAPKPKVSLFSLSSADDSTSTTTNPPQSQAYEPLVYTTTDSAPAAGPIPEPESEAAAKYLNQTAAGYPNHPQTLDNIADDLNLSRAQRRHLFGRQADSSKSRILHFNTDHEYAANQELLHQTDLASVQHNPVRAIAPGKHTLQQLVNSAQTQKEALEESFASGKRNKKEAGAKYGW